MCFKWFWKRVDKPRKHKQLIVVAAPSGAGKTTIVRHLLATFDELAFSVSATTRPRRAHEKNGEHYYFLSVDDFKSKIEHGDFLEWEEVYHNQFYGTLSSELDRLSQMGKTGYSILMFKVPSTSKRSLAKTASRSLLCLHRWKP